MNAIASNDVTAFHLAPHQERWLRVRALQVPSVNADTCIRLRCPSELSVAELERRWVRLQQRHEALRTRYQPAPGRQQPFQMIASEPNGAAVATFESTDRGIDLTLRVSGLSLDMRSARLLLDELLGLSKPASVDLGFADVSEWLRGLRESPEAEEARRFWSGVPLEAVDARPLPWMRQPSGSELRTQCTPLTAKSEASVRALTEPMGQLARADVFLGVWLALISQFNGREQISFGYEHDGRSDPDLAPVIGQLARLLPTTVAIDPTLTWQQWLTSLAARRQQWQQWAEYFDESLVPESKLVGAMPLQFAFDALDETCGFGDSVCSDWQVEPAQLRLRVAVTPNKTQLMLQYPKGVLDEPSVAVVLQSYQALLEKLPEILEQRLCECGSTLGLVLTAPGDDRVGDADMRELAPMSMPALLTHWAAQTPSALAIADPEASLSYATLQHQVARAAQRLLEFGIGRGDRVALLLPRSAAQLAACFAIWRAGAAYVAIEPETPVLRLQALIRDSGARLIVCDRALDGLDGLPVLSLPALFEGDGQEPALPPLPTAGDLAYLVYTSGTTGLPKAVMISHGALAHYVAGVQSRIQEATGSASGQRYASLSSLAADLGYTAYFGAMAIGGAVQVIPESLAHDPKALARYLGSHRLTVLKIVPSHLRALLAEVDQDEAIGILPTKTLLLGGERTDPELLRRLHALAPELLVLNHYGPSECTVGVLSACLSEHEPIVVGSAWRGTKVAVLDSDMRPVAPGFAGQLFVSGGQLAMGYLGRPSQTAMMFRPNVGGVSARCYATGDLVRQHPNGMIEFIGRVDDQVKIRGYRIELAEVEVSLRQVPGVTAAACRVLERDGRLQLAAYVVLSSGALDVPRLRSELTRLLPDYLIPTLWCALPNLPLHGNGKLNRKALPEPPRLDAEATEHVEPRTPAERALADIMGELLKRETVSIHDNFFALGGDSIIAIQIAARARRFGLSFKADQLFQYPTIAELANVVTSRQDAAPEALVINGPVVLGPIQQRFAASHPGLQGRYNHSRLFQPTVPLDPVSLRKTLAALANQHDMLRARFSVSESGWQQSVAAAWTEADVPLATVSVPAELSGSALEDWYLEQYDAAHARIDPVAGTVFVALLLQSESVSRSRLLLAVHHLVVDVVSWNILAEDLIICGPEGLGATHLPTRTSSFLSWPARLAEQANTTLWLAELPFWSAQLAGLQPTVTDHTAPLNANSYGAAKIATLKLAEATTTALSQTLARANRDGLSDAVLSALATALAKLNSRDQVWIELESHGREDLFEDIDHLRTVGWFTARFPLRIDLSKAAFAADRLRHARAAMARVPKRGIGFGVLRYLCAHEDARDFRTQPLPDVSLNYVGQMRSRESDPTLWLQAGGDPGPERSLLAPRDHLLTCIAGVFEGCLQIRVQYSGAHFTPERIQAFVQGMEQELDELLLSSPDRLHEAPNANLDELTQRDLQRVLGPVSARVSAAYALSPLQAGMLFHSQSAPGTGAYILQMRVELGAGTNVTALLSAWQDVVNAHDVLRTGFVGLGSPQPLQFVLEGVDVPVQYLDWQDRSSAQFEADLQAWLENDRRTDFVLERAPLVRICIIQKSDRTVHMVWTRHHAIIDGWSSSRVLADVVMAYAYRINGQVWPVDERPPYQRYIEWLSARSDQQDAKLFWQRYLQGVSVPTPLLNPAERQSHAGFTLDYFAELDGEQSDRLRQLARSAKTTLNVVTQAVWAKLLAIVSGHEDVVFGVVVSGRPADLPDVEQMVGPFINTHLVRARTDTSWDEYLAAMHRSQIDRDRFAHTPPTEVRAAAGLSGNNELFQSLFLFQNYATDARDFRSPDNPLELIASEALDKTNYPFTIYVAPQGALRLRLSADPKRVSAARAEAMLQSFAQMLAHLSAIGSLDGNIPELAISSHALTTATRQKPEQWLLAGTFTVEPLAPILKYWAQLFDQTADMTFAAHGQLIQVLLDPVTAQSRSNSEPVLLCLRWSDWLGEGGTTEQISMLQRNARDFEHALVAFADRVSAPIMVALCPERQELPGEVLAEVTQLNVRLLDVVRARPNIAVFDLESVLARWQVRTLHDARADAIAATPYTASAYAALASEAYRQFDARRRLPFKVLVLDCDNTLWGGVCGEVGADGVQIDGCYAAMRAAVLRAKQQGMLLAIASKNNESDVRMVFERRDLGLTLGDFVATRIDWNSKSGNIADMARELNLGLDSFVFIDDDPVQIMEVSTALPTVLALQLPDHQAEVARFLDRLWILDVPAGAGQGPDRTQQYADNRAREQLREHVQSLGDFIAGLNVTTRVSRIGDTDLSRLADLAQRTNQFNLSLNRHNEAALRQRLQAGALSGLMIQVQDRFGDYGQVGAALYDVQERALRVTDFWLSCRALGRAVEFTILRELAAIAAHRGADQIALCWTIGPRNAPALNFLDDLAQRAVGALRTPDVLTLPVEVAILMNADFGQAPLAVDANEAKVQPVSDHKSSRVLQPYRLAALQLGDADAVLAAATRQQAQPNVLRAPFVTPRTDSEKLIARLMGGLLQIDDVGVEDNFFALGGHSLLAVRLVANVAEATGLNLPLHVALESPKVGDLALRLDVLRTMQPSADSGDELEVMEI